MDDKERLKIVILQMLEHNKVHIEKYEKWARVADTKQMKAVAAFINKASKLSKSGQEVLHQALNCFELRT